MPRCLKRERHRLTIGALTAQRRATSRLDFPCAESNTICARRTIEWGKLRERTIACSCRCSASLTTKAVFGLPILRGIRERPTMRATSRVWIAEAVSVKVSRNDSREKLAWQGVLLSVQPGIRLTRSFDQRSHSYLG